MAQQHSRHLISSLFQPLQFPPGQHQTSLSLPHTLSLCVSYMNVGSE